MSELENKLQTEVGLNDEQTKQTVICIKDYLKSKSPGFFVDRLDDIFDGKKVELQEIFQDKAEDFIAEAKICLNDLAEKAENLAEMLGEKINEFIKKR